MSLLQVHGLGKSFGGVRAVDGIDFDLQAGELLALIGPNGAGKSTTFNMVNGQVRADRGSIKLDGTELVGLRPRQIWRHGVGRTFQIAETFSSLTAVENVQMALLSHDKKSFRSGRPRSIMGARKPCNCLNRSAWPNKLTDPVLSSHIATLNVWSLRLRWRIIRDCC